MNWDKVYDELTLLDKEGAGLPNRSYQLDHVQRCFFEKICESIFGWPKVLEICVFCGSRGFAVIGCGVDLAGSSMLVLD